MIGSDFLDGVRIATIFATLLVIVAFWPQARRFFGAVWHRTNARLEDRLSFGLILIALGGFIYSVNATVNSFTGHHDPLSLVSLGTRVIILFGYYQVYVAWRTAHDGRSPKLPLTFAALVLAILVAGGLIVGWFRGDL
jgi:hypothetical protein